MSQRLHGHTTALAAACLGILLATASAGVPPDLDGDGVADDADACPDTGRAEVVDDGGCSVCPCDDPWPSRGAYVACVARASRQRVVAGAMTRRARRAAIRAARHATCGKPSLTRCCVYATVDPDLDVNVGRCKMLTPERCDGLSDSSEVVEDQGPGSCDPNPCEI
jgi:hypothetical protein